MAEESVMERQRDGKGVQAYRWIVMAGLAALVFMGQQSLAKLEKTSDKVDAMQSQVADMRGTFESRINAHAQRLDTVDRRNDAQDVKIDNMWQRLWRLPEVRNP